MLVELEKVKYICKKCEIISWVDTYEDIVACKKLCLCCIKKEKSDFYKKVKESKREIYLSKAKAVCNNCNAFGTRTEFGNGNSYRCNVCGSFDVTIVKGKVV